MLNKSDLHLILSLTRTPGIGDILAKRLLNSIEEVTQLKGISRKQLRSIVGINNLDPALFFRKENMIAAERELKFIEKNGVNALYYRDSDYPVRLKQCLDAPIILFQKGNIRFSRQPVISIVGTRQLTSRGKEFCELLIEELVPFNPIIVSGFAYGTDITAHKACISKNLQTIACLAHGFQTLYPKVHQPYVEPIKEHGGFYTDFWSSDDFLPLNFLKRNRIIAGLSEATIIIESAQKGGSLVTADIANSYDREVFAVPGRPEDRLSAGCNDLIKTHRAHLISKPSDVPYLLNWNLKTESNIQTKLFHDLDKIQKQIHDHLLISGKQMIDQIAIECEIPTHKLASCLMEMELMGVIRALPGKNFEAC